MKRSIRWSALAGILAATALLPLACKKKTVEGATPVADDKTAICLYDGLGVRSTASKTGKYLASLSLGESVKCTGGPEKDETGKEFLKVVLSDGKEGWAFANGLVTGAKIGAVKDDAVLYKRPDPLTASPQKALCMAIVAVTQEKDGWLQIMGEGHRPLGWVPASAVALEKDEVATAIVATKKLREKDGLDRNAKVDAIVKLAPNPNSPFIQRLRDQAAILPPAPEAETPKSENP